MKQIEVDNIQYFDFDLKIPNDEDEFIDIAEPVILSELPHFQVFKNGDIVDLRGKSAVSINKDGYKVISFKKIYFVHRLVALAYLKNKKSYNLVNHLDGDRSNCNLDNLEWVNNTINTLHGQLCNRVVSNKNTRNSLINNRKRFGSIALTSENYKNFVKSRIMLEYDLDVNQWIFSNNSPLFLLFLPLIEKFGNFENKSTLFDDYFSGVISSIRSKFYSVNNGFVNLNIENDEDRWLIVESINKYLIPKNREDHLLSILKILKIDFDIYIDWLFEDLKSIVDDDVGFIFFDEMYHYVNLLRCRVDDNVWGVERNHRFDVLINIREEKSRNILTYEKKYHRLIDFHPRYHRIIEKINNPHVRDDKRGKIEKEVYDVLYLWVYWKRLNGGFDMD